MNQLLLSQKKALLEQFAQHLTPERYEKMVSHVKERTRYLTIVLEDVYQAHNISAVLRSADCFGVQDVHIIEQKHTFTVAKDIAKGAAQWLSVNKYAQKDGKDTARCFNDLRSKGYTIVATTPHKDDLLIQDLPLDKKIALVFGTEREGLSESALDGADLYVKVPLYGFTESLNISVCAGIVLFEITKRIRESSVSWHLTPTEEVDLLLDWLRTTASLGSAITEQLTKLTNK